MDASRAEVNYLGDRALFAVVILIGFFTSAVALLFGLWVFLLVIGRILGE